MYSVLTIKIVFNFIHFGLQHLTLQTYHYSANATQLIESSSPALKMEMWHRPGAPCAGIMTYAKMGGSWVQVGWVPEKCKKDVLELCGGKPDRLRVTLKEGYVKRGYPVLKMEVE